MAFQTEAVYMRPNSSVLVSCKTRKKEKKKTSSECLLSFQERLYSCQSYLMLGSRCTIIYAASFICDVFVGPFRSDSVAASELSSLEPSFVQFVWTY